MKVSVIVCTRDRGRLIEETLVSILKSSHKPDEIIVVDQSNNNETKRLIETMLLKQSLIRYINTNTRGLSRARNIGIEASQNDIIIFTDDDVIVEPTWIESIVSEFSFYSNLSLLYGTVLPPNSYNWNHEFVPYTLLKNLKPVKWYQRAALAGMGANMALRRTTYYTIGGFDEKLGAGTLAAGEDQEYAIRALCRYQPLLVHHTDDARVVHHAGARSGEEYRRFVRSCYGNGMGLFWAHLVKQHNLRYRLKYVQNNWFSILGFVNDVIRGRKPSGLRTYIISMGSFCRGLLSKD